MRWDFNDRRSRLMLISGFLLVTGLSISAAVYLTADNVSDSIPGYNVESSKQYIHDMELYGGKANLLASEIMNWFSGLWQGKPLAVTLSVITILVSGLLFSIARQMPRGPKTGNKNNIKQA
jgi:hypothetical protein